jgi:lipid-A-disaccharide synthase
MSKTPHVGILAGEASGDILGAGLMHALRQQVPEVRFTGIGGPEMAAAGLASRVPMDRLSVMGLTEPLKRLPELLSIRNAFYRDLKSTPPDVFIGIDSPDFNLGLEKKVKSLGIPTVHYVSPSVWAWRQGRIKTIKKAVDLMLTLFPFEENFYRQHGVPVCCVGHPLADDLPMTPDVTAARTALGLPQEAGVLALLPGSREGEVGRLCPVFLETFRLCRQTRPALKGVIACAGPGRRQQIERIMGDSCKDLDITLVDGQSTTVMTAADCVLMASGTATLEAMLLKKPMVVAYKMAPVSYAIISRMLRSPYVSLPNLLAGRKLVPELLQAAATPQALAAEVGKLLSDAGDTGDIISTWYEIHESLRRNASATAARAILALLRQDVA